MKEYTVQKLPFLRKAVIASASITRQKNTIHSFTEIDIGMGKEKIRKYESEKNYKISFTGYIVSCLSKTVEKYPEMNSFISRNRIIQINPINISVLIERNIDSMSVPEPLVISNCTEKTVLDITDEIRDTKKVESGNLGDLSDNKIIQFIPGFLLKTFVKIADKNIKMGIKYGKIAVTAVGMNSKKPMWFIPHGSATVLLSIGSIINRLVKMENGVEEKEFLCLTASFDHDLIDGAPAARFMGDLIEEIESARIIDDIMSVRSSEL